MLETLRLKISYFLDGINEGHLTWLVCLLTVIVTYLAYTIGDANFQEMSNRGLKLSSFMVYSFGLIKFLQTRKVDIWEEILNQHNVALSILLSTIIAGGAICLFL